MGTWSSSGMMENFCFLVEENGVGHSLAKSRYDHTPEWKLPVTGLALLGEEPEQRWHSPDTSISMMCSSFEIPGFLLWWKFHPQYNFDVRSHEMVSLRPFSFNLFLGFDFNCIKSKKQGHTTQSSSSIFIYLHLCMPHGQSKDKKIKEKGQLLVF